MKRIPRAILLAVAVGCSRSAPSGVADGSPRDAPTVATTSTATAQSSTSSTPSTAATRTDGGELDQPVGLGLTVGDVRRGNETLAATAGPAGASMDVCQRIAAEKLIARCTHIGHSGLGVIDTTTFELPDPTLGRGMINHYGTSKHFETGLRATSSLGIASIKNPRTKILFLGAEQLTPAERLRVQAIVESP